MNLPPSSSFLRWLRRSVLVVLLMLSVACSPFPQTGISVQPSGQTITPIKHISLPGQQLWKQGISSFLFGTNDTQEWYSNNVETSPAIQQSLKDAHLTLMRTFFFDKSLADGHSTTDAEIEQRLKTIENSGMTCLGVLFNIFDVNFDKHVVTYAGSRCQIYEFGNEPDYNGISIETYLEQWNKVIPLLRQINPEAKFIGPVSEMNDYLREFLLGVRQSGVLPDAVSFHWYPCWKNVEGVCLSKANRAGQEALLLQSWERELLGKELPVGISEWNYDPGNPAPTYGDNANFITSFSTEAIRSMAHAGVAFACQFDAASYGGYGRLDMFDVETAQPKPQYYAIKALIQQYRPSST